MKHIKNFNIKLTSDKKLAIYIYERSGRICLSVWYYARLKNIPGHENEWGTNWWKHFKLWRVR